MHTSYHNSRSANLQSIDTGAGQYAGIFVTDVISHTRDGAYGNHVYRVTYETICTYSDTVDFLWSEAGREFMAAHDLEEDDIDVLADCDSPIDDDDDYRRFQKLRALICIACDCDAVEENDGWLVVRGKIEYIGTRGSDAHEQAIENEE
jgi:hypothetical protein